ncbi:GNAT family N-acetyltransferase [Bordetella flabilis]|uniref:GNAT family N-acetyltransferase n=1 Tax=Bordetella flabilis TaxID=463014 RepID=UPI000B05C84F|nr:GNAT family N-acetyltransferase [Bordetella flabilis]
MGSFRAGADRPASGYAKRLHRPGGMLVLFRLIIRHWISLPNTMTGANTNGGVLQTPRLCLRLWQDDDLLPYVALNADARVTEFLPGPVTPDMARQFFDTQNGLYARHRCCFFAAELKSSGELAGFIGMKYQDFAAPFAPCFEIGWRLGSRFWGLGLATEGARAVVAYGFNELGLDEIVSFTVPANAGRVGSWIASV